MMKENKASANVSIIARSHIQRFVPKRWNAALFFRRNVPTYCSSFPPESSQSLAADGKRRDFASLFTVRSLHSVTDVVIVTHLQINLLLLILLAQRRRVPGRFWVREMSHLHGQE